MQNEKKIEIPVQLSQNTFNVISEAARKRKIPTKDFVELILHEWALNRITETDG